MKSVLVRNSILAFLVLIVAAACFLLLAQKRFEPWLRDQMGSYLEKRFNADVHLDGLTISFFPRIHIAGRGLALHFRGEPELPPLISVDEFSADAPLDALFRRQVAIAELSLVNLKITIPPDKSKPRELMESARTRAQTEPEPGPAGNIDFHVGRIGADGAILTILPRSPDKDPLVFELNKLSVDSLNGGQPIHFVTRMKNATPPGWIDSQGQFGPWNTMSPGKTAVSGEYVLRDADLSVFKGISGRLASTGKYHGVLQRIEVDGATDTPDFTVRTGKHPMRLTTEFHAIVDGTNGDTLLDPVRAVLAGRSTFVCTGGVYKKPGLMGKTVELDVNMEQGQIGDLLSLVVSGKPALSGLIRFHSAFELPPGDVDVLSKLKLNGSFHVTTAEFSSPAVQNNIEEFSRRSRGKPEEVTNDRVVSEMHGEFALGKGRAAISSLSFLVPGAHVNLAGAYNLYTESIDFHGTLAMDAKLSQTQKGIKSILLKVVDPFFRKNDKTVLPIMVQGTPDHVDFGLDFGHEAGKSAKKTSRTPR